jgi:xanthine/CO dehydrogenase XdhC/CoxF family maturation factor
MRKMHGLALVISLTSALVVGLACAHAGVVTKTRVRMVDQAPLTLRGVGFARDERVRLAVSLGDRTAVRKLRANDAGSFTTRFGALRYGRCGPALEVEAAGSRGSRVSWTLVPLECPDSADS